MALMLVNLFKSRFDPDMKESQTAFEEALKETTNAIEDYNTGHRYLDDARKTILFTNFDY